MEKEFKVKQICKSCSGTGIYTGLAERDGSGVICHTCKGTGCHEFIHKYEEFKSKKIIENIKHVVEVNPGICIGNKGEYKFNDFGGISYTAWLNGKSFPKGSEMRKFTCPAWWYQSANYKLKPNWDECIGVGSFAQCPNFINKINC